MDNSASQESFQGFSYPDDNGFTRFPNDMFETLAEIDNVAELKVVLYIARHTWGFQEYDTWKRFTVDELMYGRKHRDGSRMDSGTKLSEMSVRHGLDKALEHGYILCGIDERDKARKRKYYKLVMREPDDT